MSLLVKRRRSSVYSVHDRPGINRQLLEEFIKAAGLPRDFKVAERWERLNGKRLNPYFSVLPDDLGYARGLVVRRYENDDISFEVIDVRGGAAPEKSRPGWKSRLLAEYVAYFRRMKNASLFWDVIDNTYPGVPESELVAVLPNFLRVTGVRPNFFLVELGDEIRRVRLEKSESGEYFISLTDRLLGEFLNCRDGLSSHIENMASMFQARTFTLQLVKYAPNLNCGVPSCPHPVHVKVGSSRREMLNLAEFNDFLLHECASRRARKHVLQARAAAIADPLHPVRVLIENQSFLVFHDGTVATEGPIYPLCRKWIIQQRRGRGRRCCQCYIVAQHSRKCGACGVTVYCSRDCQKRAWADHKPLCEQFRLTLKEELD